MTGWIWSMMQWMWWRLLWRTLCTGRSKLNKQAKKITRHFWKQLIFRSAGFCCIEKDYLTPNLATSVWCWGFDTGKESHPAWTVVRYLYWLIKAFKAFTSASIEVRLCWFKVTAGSEGSVSATESFTRFSIVSFHCFPCDLKQSATLSDHFLLPLNSGTFKSTPYSESIASESLT